MAEVLMKPLTGWPALVLNADFRPLSYYPLSLWPWQDAVKAVFLERVDVVAQYDHEVRSPSFKMRLPSVIALREFVKQDRPPAFTRFNVFLRDGFECVYCGATEDLTFDHVIPRSKGGRTSWDNIVAACSPCNLRKGGRMPKEAGMHPKKTGGAANVIPAARDRTEIPAELSPSDLDGLPLLGCRTLWLGRD